MLEIGDTVEYDGRPHVLVGVTPMSVTPFAVQLRDPETGKVVSVDGHPRQRSPGSYEIREEAPVGRIEDARPLTILRRDAGSSADKGI